MKNRKTVLGLLVVAIVMQFLLAANVFAVTSSQTINIKNSTSG